LDYLFHPRRSLKGLPEPTPAELAMNQHQQQQTPQQESQQQAVTLTPHLFAERLVVAPHMARDGLARQQEPAYLPWG